MNGTQEDINLVKKYTPNISDNDDKKTIGDKFI
jgi:hypothetical protein